MHGDRMIHNTMCIKGIIAWRFRFIAFGSDNSFVIINYHCENYSPGYPDNDIYQTLVIVIALVYITG